MSDFKPFEDNKANWTLPTGAGNEFTLENGKKQISGYGNITIAKTEAGAKAAEELAAMFSAMAKAIRG